ncbi:MAG: hypothetical protein U1A78_00460 [Polyangia bacterium]
MSTTDVVIKRNEKKFTTRVVSALLLSAALLAGGGAAEARCYTPSDQTAGWKQAPIPDSDPALAAEPGVQQFRADEPALIWLSTDRGGVSLLSHRPGKLEYLIRPETSDWRILELTLDRSLLGEKVDVVLHTPQGLVPLWLERRASGSELHVEWSLPDVYAVTVRLHHHLREHPSVVGFRAGVRAAPSQAGLLPTRFRGKGVLYFLHPGGGTVVLCDAPGRPLVVYQSSLIEAVPTLVRLTPR